MFLTAHFRTLSELSKPRSCLNCRPESFPKGKDLVLHTERFKSVSSCTEQMTEFRFLRAPMVPEIDGNRPGVVRKSHLLRFEVPQASGRAVEKDDRLSLTMLFVIKIGTVTLDNGHGFELRGAAL